MTAPTPDSPQVRPSQPPQLWEPSGAVPPPGYVEPPPSGGYPLPAGGYPYPPGGYPPAPGGHPYLPGYPVPPGYPYLSGQPLPPGFAVPPPPGFGAALPVDPGGRPLASFGDRLLAYLIDTAVFTGIGFVLGAIGFVTLMVVQGDAILYGPEDDPFAVLVPFLILEAVLVTVVYTLLYVYYVEVMRRRGQTLGKKVMKLAVVPLDPAATLTRRDCVRRFLVQWVAGGFVPFFSYVDGFWQLWDKPFQQCLHDRYAHTVVVKVPGP